MAQQKNVVDTSPYLHENRQPLQVSTSDFRILSQEESLAYFKGKYAQSQPRTIQQQDLLCQALEASIPRSELEGDFVTEQFECNQPNGTQQTSVGPAMQQIRTADPWLGSGFQHSQTPSPGAGITISYVAETLDQQSPVAPVQTMQPAAMRVVNPTMVPNPALFVQTAQHTINQQQATVPQNGTVVIQPAVNHPQPAVAPNGTVVYQLAQQTVTQQEVSPAPNRAIVLTSPRPAQPQNDAALVPGRTVVIQSAQIQNKEHLTQSPSVSQLRQSTSRLNEPSNSHNLTPSTNKNPGSADSKTSQDESTSSGAENIMPQLLGADEECEFTPEYEETAPSKQETAGNAATGPNIMGWLSNSFQELKNILSTHHKNSMEEMEKNSRTVRCLEKTLIDHTRAVDELKETLKDLNQTLINTAREERRRQDDKKRPGEEATSQPKKAKVDDDEENRSPKVKSVLSRVIQNRVNKKN